MNEDIVNNNLDANEDDTFKPKGNHSNLKNDLKLNQLEAVNIELERNIEKMKKKHNASNFKKKLNILKSSYILTYKSMSTKKIFFFWSSLILGIIFLFLTINSISNKFLISIPTYGGTWDEGIIGIPRYINPVLANSDSDKDLTKLIFSGLMRKDENNNIVPDLVTSLEKSEDGLTYTATLNKKAKFQDGTPVTTDDVIFTINKIQDKELNSPLYLNFEGVSMEKVNDEVLIFHLKKPYIYFEESLTVGILPKHLLENLNNQQFLMTNFNTNPIGSGAYQISNIKKSNDVATEYSLISNRKYLSGRPYIDNFNIYIYQNNDDLLKALNNGTIEATSYLNRDYFKQVNTKDYTVIQKTLPNIFMLSFNPNKNSLLANRGIRLYLAKTLNKDDILNNSLNGYYTRKDNFFGDLDSLYQIDDSDIKALPASSTLTITTGDTDELKNVANQIANTWRSNGINVEILVYNLNDLNDIIKNRNFEILLFGNIIEKDIDLFAYWHSTSRNYPGLNITSYVSKNLDNNLEILRGSIDPDERKKALSNINEELSKELPAIPLYSNNFTYLIKNKDLTNIINNKIAKSLLNNSERFNDVQDWYKSTEKVWKFSYQKNLIEKLTNILH